MIHEAGPVVDLDVEPAPEPVFARGAPEADAGDAAGAGEPVLDPPGLPVVVRERARGHEAEPHVPRPGIEVALGVGFPLAPGDPLGLDGGDEDHDGVVLVLHHGVPPG